MADSINPRKLAQDVLLRIFLEHSFANLLLTEAFQKYDMSKEDRRLASELVYGILCWQGKIDWILEQTYTGDWLTLPQGVKRTMEVGAYQILFMDDVPNEIAVKEATSISVQEKGMVWGRAVNFVLLEVQRKLNKLAFPDIKKSPASAIATLWSHPKWVIEKWISHFGVERTLSLCVANNQKHRISIRMNALKTNRHDFVQSMAEENIQVWPSENLSCFFEAEDLGDILVSQSFQEHLFSIQNVSSGFIGHLLDPQSGDVILDMTAAPGQKALHCCELSQEKATVLAIDRHPKRIKMLLKNKLDYGIQRLIPIHADGRKPPVQPVSKILLDPPCSSLGAIGHLGEFKWRRQADDLPKLTKLQTSLLDAAVHCLKPGGFIIYTVSTIMPEETNEIVSRFLEKHPEFHLEKPERIPENLITSEGYFQVWPDLHGMDAIFAAKLRKR